MRRVPDTVLMKEWLLRCDSAARFLSAICLVALSGLMGCTVYDYGPGRPPVIVPGVPVAAPPPPPPAVYVPPPQGPAPPHPYVGPTDPQRGSR